MDAVYILEEGRRKPAHRLGIPSGMRALRLREPRTAISSLRRSISGIRRMIGDHDKTGRYASEDGEELSFFQIAMRARKGTSKVEEAEDGYLVDGVEYE